MFQIIITSYLQEQRYNAVTSAMSPRPWSAAGGGGGAGGQDELLLELDVAGDDHDHERPLSSMTSTANSVILQMMNGDDDRMGVDDTSNSSSTFSSDFDKSTTTSTATRGNHATSSTRSTRQDANDDSRSMKISTNHTSSRKKQQQNHTQEIAVFYNTYIGEKNATRAFAIIEEQLASLNAAWEEEEDVLLKPQLLEDEKGREGPAMIPKVYYSLFGNISNSFPNCGKMQCIPISIQSRGNEVITLQYLHEYCIDNPTHRAIYIHNKGSFTMSETSERMRKVLMTAVTSKACLNMPQDGSCDSCSSQLLLYPNLYYPGNMFVVQCEYASKLIPPKEFESAKQRVVDKMLNATTEIQKGKWYVTDLTPVGGNESLQVHYTFPKNQMWQLVKQPAMVGTGRYAMEHWLGSHPDYKPCQVFNESKYGTLENIPGILKVALDMGLEPKLEASVPPMDRNQANSFEKWLAPYFTKLSARLYLYKELYDKVPEEHSWVYSYFDKQA